MSEKSTAVRDDDHRPWSVEQTDLVDGLVTKLNGQEEEIISLYDRHRGLIKGLRSPRRRRRERERCAAFQFQTTVFEKEAAEICGDIQRLRAELGVTRGAIVALIGEKNLACSYLELNMWAWIKVGTLEGPRVRFDLLVKLTNKETGRICGKIGCLCPGFPFADSTLGARRGCGGECHFPGVGRVFFQIMEIFPFLEQVPSEVIEKVNS